MLRSRAVQPKLIINLGRWSPIGAIWTSRERTHLPKSFGRRVWLQPTRELSGGGDDAPGVLQINFGSDAEKWWALLA